MIVCIKIIGPRHPPSQLNVFCNCDIIKRLLQMESVWIKLMYKKETLMLGVVYRPPSSNNDYFNCELNQIDHAHYLNENIILMGDLHYNYKFD